MLRGGRDFDYLPATRGSSDQGDGSWWHTERLRDSLQRGTSRSSSLGRLGDAYDECAVVAPTHAIPHTWADNDLQPHESSVSPGRSALVGSAMRLVFLHGVAASGKLTTALALRDLVGYPVFHNHLVVDALSTVFPFGTEPFVRLREEFWLQVFADAALIDRSLTFTFAPESTVRPGFTDRVRATVQAHGGRVVFVRLAVSPGEQELRIGAESRRAFHKLTDVAVLRRLRSDDERVQQPPVDLEVDTDTSSPEQTAALIVKRFGLVAQPPLERYPSLP